MLARSESKDIGLEDLLIYQNEISQQLKMRLSWFLLMTISPLILPIGALKATGELLTGQPKRSLKTFSWNSFYSLALTLASFVSIFFPSIPKKIASSAFSSYKQHLDCNKEILRLTIKLDALQDHYLIREFSVKGIAVLLISPKSLPTNQYLFYFNGQGASYQGLASKRTYFEECDFLKCHVITFNYPENSNSIVDIINAGVTVVFNLVLENNWSNEEVAEHLQFYGHSLGGGIALQIALLLKEKLNLDIPIHIDRSFSSIRDYLSEQSSIPKIIGKKFFALILTASGNWELDSVKACKKLNPQMIHYYNIGHTSDFDAKKNVTSAKDKIKTFIYGKKIKDADPVIHDNATLMYGLSGKSSRAIFKGLDVNQHSHIIYTESKESNPHVLAKECFYEIRTKKNFLTLFKERVDSHIVNDVETLELSKSLVHSASRYL